MSLVKYGSGIVEITGKFAGTHFKRDRFGHHSCRMKKRIKSRSCAQAKQRNAFMVARRFCSIQECISHNIYRALNDLPLEHYHPA